MTRLLVVLAVLASGCGGRTYSPGVKGGIERALDGGHRSAKNRNRDRYRHPIETLGFFGVQDDMTVVELWPGAGWYTEVLAPVLRERGKMIAAWPTGHLLARGYEEMLRSRPDLYDRVEIVPFNPPEHASLGPDGSADMVLTFRNVHNLLSDGNEDEVWAACFAVLKAGGILGVVEHRAAPGTSEEDMKRTGYVTQDHVVEHVVAAGFRLEAQSEINANPRDTKDHPSGVWSLPPTLALGAQDRGRYLAIGESDRMTLRFVKPR